jgi:hypothetical protein
MSLSPPLSQEHATAPSGASPPMAAPQGAVRTTPRGATSSSHEQRNPQQPTADLPLPLAAERCFETRPAIRSRTALLIGLAGPSGSGKTYSALRLASGLRELSGGDIVMIDTENGRSRHYADLFDFQHVDVAPPFGSDVYRAALTAVARTRPAVIILDTLSHEHDGEGGYLDFYAAELERLGGDDPAGQQRRHLAAWRRPKAARRALLATLLRCEAHVIVCLRASERIRHPRDGALTEPVELGFMPVAGPEFIYEMTCSALLRPGAEGRPTWASALSGEHSTSKLPRQFKDIFADDTPLCERQGEAMARWALGCDAPPTRAAPRSSHAHARKPPRQQQTCSRALSVAPARAGKKKRTAT